VDLGFFPPLRISAQIWRAANGLDRSICFYSGILVLEIIRDVRPEGGEKKTFLVNKNGVFLAVTEDKIRPSVGPVNHIAFYVDDIEDAAQRL